MEVYIIYLVFIINKSLQSDETIDCLYRNKDATITTFDINRNDLYQHENTFASTFETDRLYTNVEQCILGRYILSEDTAQTNVPDCSKEIQGEECSYEKLAHVFIDDKSFQSKQSTEKINYQNYLSYNDFWFSLISNFLFIETINSDREVNKTTYLLYHIININHFDHKFYNNDNTEMIFKMQIEIINNLLTSIEIKQLQNIIYIIFSHNEYLYYSEYRLSKNPVSYIDFKELIKNETHSCFNKVNDFLYIILPEIISLKLFIEKNSMKTASNLSVLYFLKLIIKMCDCKEKYEVGNDSKYNSNKYYNYKFLISFNQEKLQIRNFIIKILDAMDNIIPYKMAYKSIHSFYMKISDSMLSYPVNREMQLNIHISDLIYNVIFLINSKFLQQLDYNINQMKFLYLNENEDIKKGTYILLLKILINGLPATYMIKLYIFLNSYITSSRIEILNLSKYKIERLDKIKKYQKMYCDFYSTNIPNNLLKKIDLFQSIMNLFRLYEMYKLTINDTSSLLGRNEFQKLYNKLTIRKHWTTPIDTRN
ncbi:hypothetical protein TCON_2326 [Astathelohania contejeani]|uniref:Uncharacterized protein n=1 Tax=Astathelohania contejeani TaxID=164912 RepID=A0ABQ7HWB5_9MICR|nr:hypothetical protein TCON_2326 [Thelohania contejeani]